MVDRCSDGKKRKSEVRGQTNADRVSPASGGRISVCCRWFDCCDAGCVIEPRVLCDDAHTLRPFAEEAITTAEPLGLCQMPAGNVELQCGTSCRGLDAG